MATGTHTWICPACGRQVPRRVDACHCGLTRQQAEARAATERARQTVVRTPRPSPTGPRGPREPLPRDVRVFLAGLAVVAVVAVGWLAFGPRPEPIVPVLGFVDAGPPPVPTPSPSPTPAFKLPWWK